MDKKRLVLFLVISFLLLLIPVFIFLSFFLPTNKKTAKPPIMPVPSSFEKDYSRIIYIVPGKTNYDGALNTLGSPISETTDKNKTMLNYLTPNPDFKNIVVLENSVVSFAVEYVYGTYRGVYSSYTKKYGQPDLTLYSQTGEGYEWFIFLKKGIGIESSNDKITQIVYFIPQEKNTFINNIASFLGLLQTKLDPPLETAY